MAAYTARRTFLNVILTMCATCVAAPLVLRDARSANLVFVFAVVWGFCFGTYYAANTSFFTLLVPAHSESQFMALFYAAGVFFNWAPPAIFTLLNQFTNATILVFFILAAFFAAAYPLIRTVDVDLARRDVAAHDSAVGIAASMIAPTLSREHFSDVESIKHPRASDDAPAKTEPRLDSPMSDV